MRTPLIAKSARNGAIGVKPESTPVPASRGPLFERREKWGILVFFSANTKSKRALYLPAGDVGPPHHVYSVAGRGSRHGYLIRQGCLQRASRHYADRLSVL